MNCERCGAYANDFGEEKQKYYKQKYNIDEWNCYWCTAIKNNPSHYKNGKFMIFDGSVRCDKKTGIIRYNKVARYRAGYIHRKIYFKDWEYQRLLRKEREANIGII